MSLWQGEFHIIPSTAHISFRPCAFLPDSEIPNENPFLHR